MDVCFEKEHVCMQQIFACAQWSHLWQENRSTSLGVLHEGGTWQPSSVEPLGGMGHCGDGAHRRWAP